MNNLSLTHHFRSELMHAAARAREGMEAMEQVNGVRQGDSFFFSGRLELPVIWVALLPHACDPGVWYFVAADEFSAVGIGDVEVPERELLAPIVIRCHVGFWAHEQVVQREGFVGRLATTTVEDARARLQEMDTGDVLVTVVSRAVEKDAYYRQWIATLHELRKQIQERILTRPILLAPQDRIGAGVDYGIVAEQRLDYTQGAIHSPELLDWPLDGCVDRFAEQTIRLRHDGASRQAEFEISTGVIRVDVHGERCNLEFRPHIATDSPPPVQSEVDAGESGTWIAGSWTASLQGEWHCSLSFPGNQSVVKLVVDGRRFRVFR
jgi:hypothetical protein